MNVSPVLFTKSVSMKANESQPSGKKEYPLKYSPATVGVVNGVCWAGIGFMFDQAYKAIFKAKGNLKTSIILNGLIGLGMGAYAYHQASKLEKSGEVTSWSDTAKFNAKKSS